MPIHDWTLAEEGDFHHFHQRWISSLTDELNGGALPHPFMALAEQIGPPNDFDFTTLQSHDQSVSRRGSLSAPPVATSSHLFQELESIDYAYRADRVIIRRGRSKVVAIIEIVSPGNKSSEQAIRSFIKKTTEIISQGIHLVVVDLFPPSARDPHGIHAAIWADFDDKPFDFLPEKPLTVALYLSSEFPTAYVESVAVGDQLPSIPLFLNDSDYIPCPLQSSYEQTWKVFPPCSRN